MKHLHIKLPDDLAAQLIDEVERTGASMSEVTRRALRHWLKQPELDLQYKHGRTKSSSVPGQANAYRADVQEP